ncbi:hypothetical protein Isop_3730 [Isosphaera pallida ATCC 43644]|uniref:Uncharacterized protein n=1 Tax=Isosphaera pallida (strain ATCC 43644 / DSM 9630 / IS1B) TaxID=575540 RepID=E8R010_ISOPI|nr:hypothetical protein [Isosphaera pallida]ADV64286.1 hypothetical protein Isop_3730 [Isosphaera pallida ATCC 43644]
MSPPSSASDSPPPVPPGLHDLSRARLTRHALERYVERFAPTLCLDRAERELRQALSRTRRLGRKPGSPQTAAHLAIAHQRIMVVILQDDAITTVLTWPQFQPKLIDFGRARLPRKQGRMIQRLKDALDNANS